jgi:hypothetical protein
MIKITSSWLFFSFLFCCLGSINAATPSVEVFAGDHSELRTDFNSKLWNNAVLFDKFTISVDFKTLKPAEQQTAVRVLADSKNLYFLIKATDSNLKKAKVGPPPLDGYLNRFPVGDHFELQLVAGVKRILAFDMNGNKYSSTGYKPDKYCEYHLVTRKTEKGWEALVTIKIASLKISKRTNTKNFRFQAVRHFDHGEGAVRSFAKGGSMTTYIALLIGGNQTNKKVK